MSDHIINSQLPQNVLIAICDLCFFMRWKLWFRSTEDVIIGLHQHAELFSCASHELSDYVLEVHEVLITATSVMILLIEF